MPRDDVIVMGAGMHPWGKWGRDFTEYGVVAARAALADAGVAWTEVGHVAGADTIRNGYPGFIAGATFAQKLGWNGARVSSNYAACASGAREPSHVLAAMGMDRSRALGSLRLSLGRMTTHEEIEEAARRMDRVVADARSAQDEL